MRFLGSSFTFLVFVLLLTIFPLPLLSAPGFIFVKNHLPLPIKVYIDENFRGDVKSNSSMNLPVISKKLHSISIRDINGKLIKFRKVSVGSGETRVIEISPPHRGSIEIVNQSNMTVQIYVNDEAKGIVQMGDTKRVTVRPGWIKLYAMHQKRVVDMRSIHLSRGETIRWEIEPLKEGEIVVTNLLPYPLKIYMNGKFIAKVESGKSIEPWRGKGVVDIVARRLNGTIQSSKTVILKAKDSIRWDIGKGKGEVFIVNETPNTIKVFMDGEPLFLLEKGEEKRVSDIPQGPRHFEAKDMDERIVASTFIKMKEGGSEWWRVKRGEGEGYVRVANLTGVSLTILVDGRMRGFVPPHEEVTLRGIPHGLRRFDAISFGEKTILTEELRVKAGMVTRWNISLPSSTILFITNPNPVDFDIYDGRNRLGIAHASTTSDFKGVRIGRITLDLVREAFGIELTFGQLMIETNPFSPSEIEIPVIKDAFILFENKTTEDVEIYLSEILYDKVKKGKKVVIGPLREGIHSLTVRDRFGSILKRQEVQCRGLDVKYIDFTPPQKGGLLVINTLPVEVWLNLDAKPAGMVGAGASLRIEDIPIGKHWVTAGYGKGMVLFEREVEISPFRDGLLEINIEPYGNLHVRNHCPTRIQILVNDRILGWVDGRGEMTFQRIPAVDSVFIAKSGDVIKKKRRFLLSPFTTLEIDVLEEPLTGEVVVKNLSEETIRIYQGSTYLMDIPPGVTRGLGEYPPGILGFSAKDSKGEVISSFLTRVKRGAEVNWEVH